MNKNETIVYLALKELCVPSGIKGYAYIKEALLILLEVDNPACLIITKDLYPQIAKKFNTTTQRIERAIRHAIERAFDFIRPETIEKIFVNLGSEQDRPTNKEFLIQVVEYMKYYGEFRGI